MEQERLIERVRHVCSADERLDAALMYGSFASGAGDEYSDIEFWLFFSHPADPLTWCAQIAPVNHLVVNEFGTHVAFFPGLIRGEFHFATIDDIASVSTWPSRSAPVDRMLVLDRSGLLGPILRALPEHPALLHVDLLSGRFANWVVLAHHVISRGEYLRGWDALGHVQRHLIWLTRLAEASTDHWLTPSRNAEAELSAHALNVVRESTSSAEPAALRAALRVAWAAGRDLGAIPVALKDELDHVLKPSS
jgi:lincosamide nucleotidyltransferase